MLSRVVAMLPGLMLPIFLVLSTAPNSSSSSRLRGTICFRRITQVDTYLQPVRYTHLVRTRKCTLLIFCKTAYQTRESYRMERRTRTTYKMRVECCEGHREVNGNCVPDELSTQEPQRTITEDSNQKTGLGSQTSTWLFKNTTEPILIGKNKELHITDSNQTTIIMTFIGCILSVFIIVVLVVIYRRRKKAAKYMGEIPYSPDDLPLPSKSKKDGPAPQEGLTYRNYPTTDENFYMSMDSGSTLPVPSVKMMLATRGSGYRFSGIDEEPRRRADTLYVTPDSASYNNHNRKAGAEVDCPEPKFPSKIQHDKSSSDIYMNGRDINATDEEEENIYSEIKSKNFKRVDPNGDESGYSFIRMECVKESQSEEEDGEAETALYASLHESNGGNPNSGIENAPNSEQADDTKGDKYESITEAKRRANTGRQGEIDEQETRDDACDSGIYTSITLDSDKDDEVNSDVTYDQPKKKTQMDETKRIEPGSDFYENCRRDSNESNYDIPRHSLVIDEEDAIYSEISSSSQTNNTPVIAGSS